MLWTTCNTDAEIRCALSNLPKDLAETYERCLQRVRANESEYSLRVLRYVYGARSPLTIFALGEALATDSETGKMSPEDVPNKDLIMDCGANLVILSQTDNFVLPAHHSVRQLFDFSESRVLRQLSLSIWNDAELDLGEMSITHLWWHDHTSATEEVQQRAPTGAGIHEVMVPGIPRMLSWVPHSKTLQLLQGMPSWRRKVQKPTVNETAPHIKITLSPQNSHHSIATANPFQAYAKQNWLSLTQTMTPDSAKWGCFTDLVLSPKVVGSSHPWFPTMQEHVEESIYLHRILEWAIINHHAVLLVLIGEKAPAGKMEKHSLFNKPLLGSGGLLPIHLAAKVAAARVVDTISNLCDLTAICQQTGRDALFFAAERDSSEVFELLSHHGSLSWPFNVDHAGRNYFEAATDAGLLTPWLIKHRAKIGSLKLQRTSFLIHAIKTSRNPAIDCLLQPEIYMMLRSDELGARSEQKFDSEILSWLLKHGLGRGIPSITKQGISLEMNIETSGFKKSGDRKILCPPIFHALINHDANLAIALVECGASLWSILYLTSRDANPAVLRPIDLALVFNLQEVADCIVKTMFDRLIGPANLTLLQSHVVEIDLKWSLPTTVWMSFLVETQDCQIATVQCHCKAHCFAREESDQKGYWWADTFSTNHPPEGTKITVSSKQKPVDGVSFTLMKGFNDHATSMRGRISTTAHLAAMVSVSLSNREYNLQQSLSSHHEIKVINVMRGTIK